MRDAADNWRGSERDEPWREFFFRDCDTFSVLWKKNVGGVFTKLLYKSGKCVVVVLFQINQFLKNKTRVIAVI